MTALEAFEAITKAHPLRGLMPEVFLAKLEALDPANPEFLYKDVDNDWQMFRLGWIAAREAE